MMSTALLVFAGGAIIAVLLGRLLRVKGSPPHPKFIGGMAGDTPIQIPGSSMALHAELIAAAERHMGFQQKLELKSIFDLVTSSRYSEAMELITHALGAQLAPDHRLLLLWLKSNVCQRAGEVEGEIAVLETLCALRSHRMFELNLGNAYAKCGDYAAAEKRLLKAISLANGAYPLARHNLGCLYCRMKRKNDAVVQLKALEDSTEEVPGELLDMLRLRISELG